MFIKKIILFVNLILFMPGSVSSLNLFELFLIKTGAAMVYDQYFDKSLNYESELSKKNKILSNYYENKSQNISFRSFKNLPMQQQMLIIEEINYLNN
tara:strand:+ start:191 stop:481 length:291 start_codon:yes stop_codon:yes gene_type:complete